MDKRYQTFVSSTYTDLKDERAEVIRVLLALNCIPSGMEMFPASDERQWELIKRVIDDCDYYILILAGRYGSIAEEGISYTEREFDYAVEKGIPILVFPIEDPNKIIAEKIELNEEARAKLEAFRAKAMEGRTVDMWDSPKDLAGNVAIALANAMKLEEAEGWVRASYASDAEANLKYKERIEELEAQLETATTRPPEGIDDLAQGGNRCSIRYSAYNPDENTKGQYKIGVTWDNVVSFLGPVMFDEASEQGLRLALNHLLSNRVEDEYCRSPDANEEDFQTIKVQLMALGITHKSERKRTPSDKDTYWSLTPYGAHYVTKLKAVRRE